MIINFGALAIGQIFTGTGVTSDWYQNLPKAPWTPPGWVFGAAWFTVMACFTVYMAYAWEIIANKQVLLSLFIVQWVLNVGWNPVFFYFHEVLAGLAVITLLTLVVVTFLLGYSAQMKLKSLWVLPYFLWLLVASSLNGYIYFTLAA